MDRLSTTSPSVPLGNNDGRPRRPGAPFGSHLSLTPLRTYPALEKPFSLQNRRLQLRNAGFRAVQLPGLTIADHLASSRSSSWNVDPEHDEICCPGTLEPGADLFRGHSPWGGFDVVQRRVRSRSGSRQELPRPSMASIFLPPLDKDSQSSQRGGSLSESCAGTALTRSTFQSLQRHSDDTRGMLPDPSGEQIFESFPSSAPDNSPVMKSRQRLMRNSSYATSKYIEHLETQLEIQMDRSGSPSAKAQIRRLRLLNAEIKSLKRELADWKSRFAARVSDATTDLVDNNAALRTKIRTLEIQVEAERFRIKELEYDNEMQAKKLWNAESLNITNRNLEKRIDVLTELLAQSPNRGQFTASPGRDHSWFSASNNETSLRRPRSMTPSIPISPLQRHSPFEPLATCGSGICKFRTNFTTDIRVQDMDIQGDDQVQTFSQEQATARTPPDVTSTDSSSGCSVSGLSVPKSQRSSITSQSSLSSTWSLQFPLSPENQSRVQSRYRKMRRFPSGSCTLKPLILSTAAAAPAEFSPSRAENSHSSQKSEPQSSLDPTTAFLDMYIPESDQMQTVRALWAQRESLDALEERSHCYQSFEEALNRRDPGLDDLPAGLVTNHGLGLQIEENAVLNTTYASIAQEVGSTIFDGTPCPGDVRISHDDGRISGSQEASTDHSIVYLSPRGYCYKTPTKLQTKDSGMPFQRNNTAPASVRTDLTPVCAGSSHISGSTCSGAAKVSAKCPNYFRELRDQPITLIRHILRRAWCRNWDGLHKLSRWILGLFFGSKFRDKQLLKLNDAEAGRYNGWSYFGFSSYRIERPPFPDVNCQVGLGQALKSPSIDPPGITYSTWKQSAGEPDVERTFQRSSIRRSISLWAKFSYVLLLAIRIAVKDGPEKLLGACPSCCEGSGEFMGGTLSSDALFTPSSQITTVRRHDCAASIGHPPAADQTCGVNPFLIPRLSFGNF